MAYILHIETSSTICSVALSFKDQCIGIKEENKGYTHAESLFTFLLDLFKECKLNPNQLNAVAVSSGPGSYTGLRIGISAAKGFCFAHNIPLISINTLHIQANDPSLLDKLSEFDLICSMSDARRMEVYECLLNKQLQEIYSTKPTIVNENFLLDYLHKNTIYFIGNTVDKVEPFIQHPKAVIVKNVLPSAQKMITLGYSKYLNKIFEDIAYFEPNYLKEGIFKGG